VHVNIKISDAITLAKRKNTSNWQAVIKAPDGKWRRISTKTSDEQKAAEIAYEKLAEWRVLDARGIPIVNEIKFKIATQKYMDHLQKAIDAGSATKSQASYKSYITNWLIPFFGEVSVKAIDEYKLQEFDQYRIERMERIPAKGTINQHNISLRAVLEFCVHQKWCKAYEIPKLTVKGKGRAAVRRGYFEPEEFNELMKYMVTWRDDADRYIVKYKRDVLRLYVYFLVATGMRPGTELNNIRWSNFQHVKKGKSSKSYYRLFVMEGKKQGRLAPDQTKQSTRTVMVSEEAYEFIVLLKEKRTNVKDDDLVFCMPDGGPITGSL